MAAHDRRNGEDPFPPVPRRNPVAQRPPLREALDPLEEELHGPVGKKIVEHNVAFLSRLDHLDSDLVSLGESMISGFASVQGQLSKFEEHLSETRTILQQATKMPPLPPMRPESSSSHDLAKHVSAEIAEKVAAEIRNPSTPPPDKEKVAAISVDMIQAAVNQVKTALKAENWDKLEAERKAAEADRLALLKAAEADKLELAKTNAREKLRMKWTAIGAVVTAAITTTVFIVEHFVTRAH
jgi:hypothetical protein